MAVYPSGVQYENGRPFIYMPDGSKNWISPAAFGQGGGQYGTSGPDAPSFLHTGSQWNQNTGQWENPINWSNILSLAVGGGLGVGGLAAAGALGGAGAGAGAAGAGTGAGAGAAAGTTAGLLPATAIGTGALGPIAGGTGLAAGAGAGAGTGGLLGTLANTYGRYQQVAGLAGAGVGGYVPNTATSTTNPTLDPALQPLQQAVLQQIMGRLGSGDSLPPGYETGGIKSINNTFDLVNQGRQNDLTARGLSTSPVAAASDTGYANRRAGAIGDFRANLPLINRDLQNQDLNAAMGLLNFGRGATSTQQSGGGWGGVATNLATMLGYYYGQRRAGA